LISLRAAPPPHPIPDHYRRRDPACEDQRALLFSLTASADWASLTWPDLVEELFALGRTDVPTARLAEGHIDACRILAQAGRRPAIGSLYGVWASHSRGTGLTGRRDADIVRLDGEIRFASGAGVIDRALVPVLVDGDDCLFDIDTKELHVDSSVWETTAMAASRTFTVTALDLSVDHGQQIDQPGFYLGRPGFFPGGVGVAAVWAGGAARVVDLCCAYVATAPPSPARDARLGRMRTDLAAAYSVIRQAALLLSTLQGDVDVRAEDWRGIATETRAVTADAITRLIAEARVVVGAAGLAFDGQIASAIDDVALYVMQRSPDFDAGWLGEQLHTNR
jgi:hypothetical protein